MIQFLAASFADSVSNLLPLCAIEGIGALVIIGVIFARQSRKNDEDGEMDDERDDER